MCLKLLYFIRVYTYIKYISYIYEYFYIKPLRHEIIQDTIKKIDDANK